MNIFQDQRSHSIIFKMSSILSKITQNTKNQEMLKWLGVRQSGKKKAKIKKI